MVHALAITSPRPDLLEVDLTSLPDAARQRAWAALVFQRGIWLNVPGLTLRRRT